MKSFADLKTQGMHLKAKRKRVQFSKCCNVQYSKCF